MPIPSYDEWLEASRRIASKYFSVTSRRPAETDVAHNLYRLGFEGYTLDGVLRGIETEHGGPPPPPPPPPPPVGSAVPLMTAGNFRRLDNDAIWKYRGVTAFTALWDALHDRWGKLEAYADWTRSIGGNAWRVFGMWTNLGFRPIDFPRYYDALGALSSWARSRGLWLHFVAFTDQQDGSPIQLAQDVQDAHLGAVVSALRGTPTILEAVNEDWKNGAIAGRWPASAFGDLPATRSSWPDGQLPNDIGTILSFTTEHTPRDSEWVRKAKSLVDIARLGVEWDDDNGHHQLDPTHRPAIAGEPLRLDDATPEDYATYLAIAEMFGAGGCLHGGFASFDPRHRTDLQNCIAPAPGTHGDQVAQRVADLVWRQPIIPDIAAADWQYTRGPFATLAFQHSDDLALRTFGMFSGHRQVVIVVRPTDDWRPIVQDGWRIVESRHPIYLCER